ncbi:hypothetical protein BGZ70_008268 [Mortierella alpina]|uniref:WKF domain-containing protein n=1 Tax=Mortierella alpina TaxID=64518 RepID=A0A9P6J427_MORAP|nr:hypothetical protein BGZ70_008268 [Mortierella alpina]
MSDSTTKRVKVPKPEKKKPMRTSETSTDAAVETPATEEPLIDIPVVKKKKERRVKTEADIAAKQERKRLRKEAELAKKGPAAAAASAPKPTVQNKTPKWKQFLKNSSEADNAEQLKDTSYKVKGDDGSGDEDSDSDSESDEDKAKASKKKADKKRKSDKDMENGASKSKKSKKEDSSKLASLDTATPGLAYLVEWKRARATWKFQKLRQVWLINNMYDDMQLPSTHWGIFLDYIHDLKGAARTAAIQEAKKIVEAPEPEEDEKENEDDKEKDVGEEKSEDEEMKDVNAESEESTIPLSEEEKAAEEEAKAAKVEAKRAAEVKAARALDVLRVLA